MDASFTMCVQLDTPRQILHVLTWMWKLELVPQQQRRGILSRPWERVWGGRAGEDVHEYQGAVGEEE